MCPGNSGDVILSVVESDGTCFALLVGLRRSNVSNNNNSSRSLSFGLLSGSNFEYCEVSRAPGEGSSVVLEVPGGKLRAEVEEVGFTEDGSHRLKMLGNGGRG